MTIDNKNVILSRYKNRNFCVNPVFMCETLFLHQCDDIFLANCLNRKTFPQVQKIYLASKPHDPYMLIGQFKEIYLHESFKKYTVQWYNMDNIKLISGEEYINLLESFDSEKLLYRE